MTNQSKKGTPETSPAGDGEDKQRRQRISIPMLLCWFFGAGVSQALLPHSLKLPMGSQPLCPLSQQGGSPLATAAHAMQNLLAGEGRALRWQ